MGEFLKNNASNAINDAIFGRAHCLVLRKVYGLRIQKHLRNHFKDKILWGTSLKKITPRALVLSHRQFMICL